MRYRFVGLAAALAAIPLTAAVGAGSVFAAAPPNPPAVHGSASGTNGQQQHPINPGGPKLPVINPGGPKLPPHPPVVNPGGPKLPPHPSWGSRGHRDWAPGHHPEPRHWNDHDSVWNYWYRQGFHDGWLGLHHRHDLGGQRQQAYDDGYRDGAYAADHD